MSGYVAEALRHLGHEVLVFDGRGGGAVALLERAGEKLLRRSDKPLANKFLRQSIRKSIPDFFLTIFGFDVSAKTLAFLKAWKIPTACWWLNDPFQFGRSLQKASLYDFIFTNARESVADYRAAGVPNAFWLPVGCAPEVHRRVGSEPAWESEVCFAGDWEDKREALLLKLAPLCKLRIFGPWKKKLAKGSPLLPLLHDGFFTPEQMARMFSSAKLVINLHTWFEKFDYGTNPRLFEAAGCGAAQLVDWKREIPELFKEGEEILTYRKLDEVAVRVKELLAEPERLKKMGEAAQRRAYAEHTYEHRMRELLSKVFPSAL